MLESWEVSDKCRVHCHWCHWCPHTPPASFHSVTPFPPVMETILYGEIIQSYVMLSTISAIMPVHIHPAWTVMELLLHNIRTLQTDT